ncbi:hypothetical protein CDAR_509791 [Caerostris darwini]|uniref:Uncharacterized protein n=1 Tax=Caerostris darwini TaxID=1538125 RepID=A0AAV4QML8_9ARAC|nr:hypothetical protein CDAR_509791 [Caerostris darwini]
MKPVFRNPYSIDTLNAVLPSPLECSIHLKLPFYDPSRTINTRTSARPLFGRNQNETLKQTISIGLDVQQQLSATHVQQTRFILASACCPRQMQRALGQPCGPSPRVSRHPPSRKAPFRREGHKILEIFCRGWMWPHRCVEVCLSRADVTPQTKSS